MAHAFRFARRTLLGIRGMFDGLADRWLNIHTSDGEAIACSPGGSMGDGTHYAAVNYFALYWYLRAMPSISEDVIFDIGAGRGRLLCLLARRSVKKCVGVEIDASLVKLAIENIGSLRGRKAPVDVVLTDAASADYSDGTIFCLFNPFGSRTLRLVVDRIHATLAIRPRRVQILYINPAHEHVLLDTKWLSFCFRRRCVLSRSAASYWVSKGA